MDMEATEEDPLSQQANASVQEASSLLTLCIDKVRVTDSFRDMDHVPNRNEMINFLQNMTSCRTKNELMEFFDLSPNKEKVLGNLAIVLAVLDAWIFDILSLITAYMAGHMYLFTVGLLLLVVSMVAQIIRIIDIGKEVYNLSKMLKVGFYPNVNLRPYDYANMPKAVTRAWLKFKTTLNFVLNYRGLPIIDPCPDEIDELTGFEVVKDGFSIPDIQDIFWIIDESIHRIPVIFYFFAPSIPLNALVVRRTTRLAERLNNPGSWVNGKALLKIYCEAAFLHLVKFEAAEMTLTEMGLEGIPQLFMGIIPFAYLLVWDGIWPTFASQTWFDIVMFIVRFVPLGISMVMGTFGKMCFYFQVYDQGESFITIRNGQPAVGVKYMDHKLINKIISILGHVLTIGPIVFVLSLSCTSCLGPVPLLLIVLGYGWIFQKTAAQNIPFYATYLTWSNVVSTLSVTKPDMLLDKTFWTLMKKIGWLAVVLSFLTALFSLEFFLRDLNDTEHLYNLFILMGSLQLIYILGSLVLFADRLYWRYSWGENFDLYVKPKKLT